MVDSKGVEIKVGDNIEFNPPVAYIGGKFPDPTKGVIVEIDGQLVFDDGEYKTPVENYHWNSWNIID